MKQEKSGVDREDRVRSRSDETRGGGPRLYQSKENDRKREKILSWVRPNSMRLVKIRL